MQNKCEASQLLVEFVNQVHRDIHMDNSSEFTSFAQNILSSPELSDIDLSENDKQKRTDPQVLKAIPGLAPSSILSSWGEEERNKLQTILKEYEDIFRKINLTLANVKLRNIA